ncbi:MAG: stage II sporulation protein D [Faecousia sp.]
MNGWGKDLLISLMVGLVIPGVVLKGAVVMTAQEAPEPTAGNSLVSLPVKVRGPDGAVREGDLEEYLVGVVLAEMPASFETEALKAQSVVARTYARKAYETGGKHEDGSVCTVPECCQGYVSEEEYLRQGGLEADVAKVREAVTATAGQVLTYEGELIEATYFSCSGGSTEDAVVVWGTDYPYLQSVDSPGEEEAAHYREKTVFAPEEVEEKLGVELAEDPTDWIGKVSYTAGGSVESAVIGDRCFTGTEIRRLLGLYSAAFTVVAEPDAVTFTTKGYGHRVGLSQYGADAMAVKGYSYREILAHYYQSTELVSETDIP